MKKNNSLKLTLIILIIILISIISFVGIYVENKNSMENIIPNYALARDLNEYRIVELKVNDEKTTTNYDENGKEIEKTDTETQVASTEEKAINPEEILTPENYKKSKNIIEKRLATMGITDYVIKQNKENGTIVLELPENEDSEKVANQLPLKGKFEIIDSDTEEVLMTNDDLESVKAGYGTSSSGTVAVYINFQFNKEGTQKFKDITNTYIETTVEDSTTEEENTIEEGNVPEETNTVNEENVLEEQEETNEDEDTTDKEPETVKKQITMKIDDNKIIETYFSEEIPNGLLQLTLGTSKSTTEELQEYFKQATGLVAELESGIMPIEYETNKNEVITASVNTNTIKIIGIITASIFAVALLFIIIKFKIKGILASISLIGYVAVFLLAIRYFNVVISMEGILAILFSIAVSYGIIFSILKQKEVLKAVGKCSVALIPTLIIAISLTFANIIIGAVLFWGVSIALLYHLSISNLLLKD